MIENSFDNSKNEKKKNINENKKDNFILEKVLIIIMIQSKIKIFL